MNPHPSSKPGDAARSLAVQRRNWFLSIHASHRFAAVRLRPLRLLVATLLALALSCYAAAHNPPLVLGSYAYSGLDRVAAMQPLAKVVAKATGQLVEIRLYGSPDELATAVRIGEVDVAIANLGAWLSLARDPAVQPLAVVVPPASVQSRYRAVLLARHDLPAASLEEVMAEPGAWRLAAVIPGSASGGLVQSIALAQAGGAEPQWLSIGYFGSHEGALAALANGVADLAAVAEAPWIDWQLAQAGQGEPTETRELPFVVWQSPPLPSGTLTCRSSSRIDCTALSYALTRSTLETRKAALYLGHGWPEWAGARRFAPYDHAIYTGLGLAGDVPPAER